MRWLVGLLVAILCSSGIARGQGYVDELNERMVEDSLSEGVLDENAPNSVILDISRTKVGRDFYESFYQQWSNVRLSLPVNAQGDSVLVDQKLPPVFNLNEYVITIEELATPTNGLTSLVSINVDNQIIWQQFVQARRDILDEYAGYAVETVRQYFIEIQSVQAQLGDDDQKGNGIY